MQARLKRQLGTHAVREEMRGHLLRRSDPGRRGDGILNTAHGQRSAAAGTWAGAAGRHRPATAHQNDTAGPRGGKPASGDSHTCSRKRMQHPRHLTLVMAPDRGQPNCTPGQETAAWGGGAAGGQLKVMGKSWLQSESPGKQKA